jgi:hypothetical protein
MKTLPVNFFLINLTPMCFCLYVLLVFKINWEQINIWFKFDLSINKNILSLFYFYLFSMINEGGKNLDCKMSKILTKNYEANLLDLKIPKNLYKKRGDFRWWQRKRFLWPRVPNKSQYTHHGNKMVQK